MLVLCSNILKRLGCDCFGAATSASLSGSPGASPGPSPASPQQAAQTPQSERAGAAEPAEAMPPAASPSGQALPGPGRQGAALSQFVLERIRNVRSSAAPVGVPVPLHSPLSSAESLLHPCC